MKCPLTWPVCQSLLSKIPSSSITGDRDPLLAFGVVGPMVCVNFVRNHAHRRNLIGGRREQPGLAKPARKIDRSGLLRIRNQAMDRTVIADDQNFAVVLQSQSK